MKPNVLYCAARYRNKSSECKNLGKLSIHKHFQKKRDPGGASQTK